MTGKLELMLKEGGDDANINAEHSIFDEENDKIEGVSG